MANLGLLVLRVWLGVSIFCNHGMDKLLNFNTYAVKFPDLLGIGSRGNLALVVFAEFFCGALLALGLLSRFAALVLTINMGVAFFIAHKMVLSGEKSGELAFVYLAGYFALLLAGPGRYSIDSSLFAKCAEPRQPK
jgi:putative oxidoreductase